MKKAWLIFCFLLTAGCMRPLYETDYPLYRQYKYWESGDKDWQNIDYFQVQAFRTQAGEKTSLRLVPQRDGLPSTRDGYLQAAQKAAFNLMTQICGSAVPAPDQARAPETDARSTVFLSICRRVCRNNFFLPFGNAQRYGSGSRTAKMVFGGQTLGQHQRA